MTRAVLRLVRDRRGLAIVFGLGLVVRGVLIPLGHGQDFVVWDRAAAATLRGVNVYVHHPAYPGGPYAYSPLFLYLELPMRWLAGVSGLGFTTLGKLPILAGDVATAVLIGETVAARGAGRRAVMMAVAGFFLNPLVLYDSAYYGRFDSLGCALLLLALRQFRRRGEDSVSGAGWYGLAVAVKTFPAFAAAGVIRAAKGARLRTALVIGAVLTLVVLPYLGSWRAILRDVIGYDVAKFPQGLSWQTLVLKVVDSEDARVVSYLLLAVFVAGTVWLTRIPALDRYVLLTLLLFICLSKVVLEQYLVWPVPWLAIAAMTPAVRTRRISVLLLLTLTVIGIVDNESFHPFGRSSSWLAVLLTVACFSYLVLVLRDEAASGQYPRDRGPSVTRVTV